EQVFDSMKRQLVHQRLRGGARERSFSHAASREADTASRARETAGGDPDLGDGRSGGRAYHAREAGAGGCSNQFAVGPRGPGRKGARRLPSPPSRARSGDKSPPASGRRRPNRTASCSPSTTTFSCSTADWTLFASRSSSPSSTTSWA